MRRQMPKKVLSTKSVSKDDTEVLQHLEQTLKRAVYGQDEAVAGLLSLFEKACRSHKKGPLDPPRK